MMSRFNFKSMSPPNELIARQIRFLHEQDGVPEKELKTRLSECFKHERCVKTAYLVKVEYDGSNAYNVALCLNASQGSDKALVNKVHSIFASMFGYHEHLDIVFLSTEQEDEVAGVCQPFFGVIAT